MSSVMKNYRDDQRRKRENRPPVRRVQTMMLTADSKEELEEAIAEHASTGWRENGRKIERDGTFHATLAK